MQRICDLFLKTLQATAGYSDITNMTYVRPEQPSRYESYVDVTFDDGEIIRVNTSMDSGVGMIFDILNQTR